jgi:hypothetical protein
VVAVRGWGAAFGLNRRLARADEVVILQMRPWHGGLGRRTYGGDVAVGPARNPRQTSRLGASRGSNAEGRRRAAGDARRTGTRDVAARRRPDRNSLMSTSLKTIFSKVLYISAANFEHESCRCSYPLPLSKRLYRVFLNRICKKQLPTLNANLCS